MATTDERRTLAMIATEAAMQVERDPLRFARLQQRNWMARGPASRPTIEAVEALIRDSVRDPVGLAQLRDDLLWLEDVDLGLWTPTPDFSNCLVTPPPQVTLWLLWHDAMQSFTMPRDGSKLSIALDDARLNNNDLGLRAAGGAIDLQWVGSVFSVLIDDGRAFVPHWPLTTISPSLVARRHVGKSDVFERSPRYEDDGEED